MGWFSKKPKIPNGEKFLELYQAGADAFHKGDLQRSIDTLLSAINAIEGKVTKLSAEAWCYIGIAQMRLFDEEQRNGDITRFSDGKSKRLSDAEGALLSARALTSFAVSDPSTRPRALYNLGVCYTKQERYAESERCFLDYVKLNPDVNGFLKLGFICYKTGRRAEAIEYCERALAIDPNDANARHNLAGLRGGG